jgi:diaminopimelate decarboxylase
MIHHPEIVSEIIRLSENQHQPFYLYQTKVIQENCSIFKRIAYPEKNIHFASMANANPTFLKIIKKSGLNIFVNSPLHLDAAIEAGFRAKEIIYTASGLSEEIMQMIGKHDLQVNLDSLNQLLLWSKLFPAKQVGIRCNIGDAVQPYSSHAGTFIGKESRLGFTADDLAKIPDRTIINGLHLYAGTDITDIDYMISCYEQLANLAMDFPNIEYLNFGGGFALNESGEHNFYFDAYSKKVSELLEKVSAQKRKRIKMILEPGRMIGGNAGYFVCRVTDIKNRADKTLVGVNASTVQFSRPLLYPDEARHPISIIRNGKQLTNSKTQNTTVFGCSTYSRDIFAHDIQLPELQINDLVIFENAGSYCASSYLHFLGFPKPEEYFTPNL